MKFTGMNYTQQQRDDMSRRVAMKIVKFVTDRPKQGRRGSPAIPEGTTLYAIAYHHVKGGFFTYSYMNRDDAQKAIDNTKMHQTDNEFYYPWNVVYNVQDTLHVASKK